MKRKQSSATDSWLDTLPVDVGGKGLPVPTKQRAQSEPPTLTHITAADGSSVTVTTKVDDGELHITVFGADKQTPLAAFVRRAKGGAA